MSLPLIYAQFGSNPCFLTLSSLTTPERYCNPGRCHTLVRVDPVSIPSLNRHPDAGGITPPHPTSPSRISIRRVSVRAVQHVPVAKNERRRDWIDTGSFPTLIVQLLANKHTFVKQPPQFLLNRTLN